MKKIIRVQLNENKSNKVLLERGILSGATRQFADYLALENFLNSTTDAQLKEQWAEVQRQTKYTSGTPLGNVAGYKQFGDYIMAIQTMLADSVPGGYSFINDLLTDEPSVQTFFLAYGSGGSADFKSINSENIQKIMVDFYKASVVPYMIKDQEDKINSVDYAFSTYLSTILKQMQPRFEILKKNVEIAKSRQGSGVFAKISKSLMGDGNDEISQANQQLKRLIASWIASAIGKKKDGDSISKSIAGGSSTAAGGGTTTPESGEGAAGGAAGGAGEGTAGGAGTISQDTPLSITRQQKLKTGAGGENEMPLVTQMQKLGVSQQTAQQLSKRIANYLKQRNIPLAEAINSGLLHELINEATFADRKAARKAALDAKSKVPQGKPLKVAEPKNDERHSVIRKRFGQELQALRAEIAELEAEVASPASPEGKRMAQRDLTVKKKELADKEKQLFIFKTNKAADKQLANVQTKQTRSDVRDIGANLGVVGKIISRFISDNQTMLTKDANVKKMLENPTEFKKFVDNIRNLLKRQMKRRGYDDTQINKLLENYNLELNVRNLLLEANKKNVSLLNEYHEHIHNELLPYMQKQIGFNKPPVINFLDDTQNASDPLGKTAYYNPQTMEISVYTTGRHPKDIMRSVAHEVIHHAQNCRGQLNPETMGEASEGYAQANPYLRKLEEEAYLLGNMTFRDWEDTHKKGNTIMEKELEEEMCEHNKVHPGMSHAAYKRDDKPLNEWKNQELFGLLMKKFGIIAEKGSKPDFLDLDKDGDKEEPMKKAAKEKKDDSSLEEEKMTKGEKKEKEKIVKGMKKNKKDFEKRYPGRGEQVMYATATKKAMEK